MMRWKATIWTLAVAFATFVGCSHREFLNQADFEKFHRENHLPLGMDTNPTLSAGPVSAERPPVPANIDDPERKPRHVTLAECIAQALENGNTGIQSVRQLGLIDDDLLRGPSLFAGPNGFPFINADSLRVLSLNPAISGLGIDQALSRYDTGSVTSVGGSFVDQPIQGINSFQNGYFGRFASTLFKELPTGGLAAATFGTQYQNLSRPPTGFSLLNPAYTPSLQFTFEQPLWQNFGTTINQLLSRGQSLGNELNRAHPEATQFLQGRAASTNTGASIMLSRIRFDQSRAELERAVNFTLVNVEVAYWNLYGAYVSLYSSEMALRQSYEAWRITKAKYEAGSKDAPITQFAQTRGQFELFRGDRLQALGRVLEAERVLRSLMGLPPDDGTQLVPVDTPNLTAYRPDWGSAVEEALTLRPELVVARHELKALQFDLTVQKNFLKPDVRLQSSYRIDALGTRLDGNGEFFDQSLGRFRPDNAFRGLASNHYNSWDIGVTAQIPLGYRFENAAVRRARLALAQGYLTVKREEDKAQLYLAKAYRDIIEGYRLIGARRAQREAFAEQVAARFKEYVAGKTTADFLLEAQRQWANALSTEYQAIVAYNNAIATFHFAKGTIMNHDGVSIAEGALPQCVLGRAVEHERERSHALLLREHANLVVHPPASPEDGVAGLPKLPDAQAPSVPALMGGAPPVPDQLPPPRPAEQASQVRLPEWKGITSPPAPVEPKAPRAADAAPQGKTPEASKAPERGPVTLTPASRERSPMSGAPLMLPTPPIAPPPPPAATTLPAPPVLPAPPASKGPGADPLRLPTLQ